MPEPAGYAVHLERDVVEAVGEESGPFLQGQLSQDVLALPDGASAWSWLLSPQGKVDALVRVTRLSAQRWLLDTDRGWGERVVERINRFKLRTKVTVEARGWSVLGLRGPGAAWEDGLPGGDVVAAVDPAWPGVVGVDIVGPDVGVPEGWRLMDPAGHEARRIAAGIPRMGAELDERTIPGETGLVARTVSFTKGCYTGQELVARVDSRGGNVPRRLARLAPAGPVDPGTALVKEGGDPAGTLTSVAEEPEGVFVALGYLRRGVGEQDRLVAAATGEPVAFMGLVE